ncbi:MAG: hypothetical protein JWO06_2972 [Bacteroidota bacterium]|nr:hypothetical protein [Bacteroidota bacterium]
MHKILAKALILLVITISAAGYSFAQNVKFDEWKNITTSGKLPPQCKIQRSNNNLDVVKYKDRYYFAFRTAPTHFASRKTVMYVVSSKDLENWEYETEIKLGCDLREPKFAVYHDTLNFYCFTAGTSLFTFDPRLILRSITTGEHTWSKSESVNMDGFVPWRLRLKNDTLFLSAYYGKNLYNTKHQANLRLFYSTNARDFIKVSEKPQVDIEAAEEGEFIFDKAGNLFATVRLEGTGALVCKADKSAIGTWTTNRVKTKYDSALLFDHNDEVYLVSRRNLDGDMDKVKVRKNEKQRRARNLIRYSITRKVTSLFKFNKEKLTLDLVTDFPSTGDNSFPGVVKLDNDTYLLMNYSSNIHGHKKNWIRGQFGKTYIYWTKLKFNQ